MPTMSQCQILNNLVEKSIAPKENPAADEEDGKHEGVKFISVMARTSQLEDPGGCAQASRSGGGKLEAAFSTSDHEITPFQMKRMQMAINTTQLLRAWRQRSTQNKTFNRFTSMSNIKNPENCISQTEKSLGNLYQKDKFVSSSNASMQAFLPWRKAMSRTHLLISPVLDNFQRQRTLHQLVSPQTVLSESSAVDRDAESEVKGDLEVKDRNEPTTNIQTRKYEETAVQGTSDENCEPSAGKKIQRIVSNEQFMAAKCPDTVKNHLYQLGWRNPKQKKTKKKKKEDRPTNPRLSYMTAPKLNLMKDPLLLKLSKKCKNLMVHTHSPEMRPRAVCFDVLGAHLTHLIVWTSFKRDVLSEYEEVKVESIQFVPRSIFLPRMKNADPVENRWVITLTNEWHRSRVTGMKIHFGEFETQLRRYDDVANLEYRQYTRMTGMMDMVKANS